MQIRVIAGTRKASSSFGAKAAKHRLVMVQPDTYICGHILDRYADANGEDSVVKV